MKKDLIQFISVSLALTSFACGQNAHVTRANPGTVAGTVSGNPNPQSKDGMGPTGSQGLPGAVGATGRAGKDGCGNIPFVATFDARPLTDAETATAVLPYQSANGHGFTTLEIGDMTGIAPGGIPYVQNSQVTFAFDALLPPKVTVQNIQRASIEVAVMKLANACNVGSEILCSLDNRVCSGLAYDKNTWQANYNPAFWGAIDAASTNNTLFSDLLLQHRMKNISNMWASGNISIDVTDFLKGSKSDDVLQFLYGNDTGNKTADHTLRFALAEDVYVSTAHLTLEFDVDTCAAKE